MHHLSYNKSRSFTDTPTNSGTRQCHVQGVPSQLFSSEHVIWSQATVKPSVCRNAVFIHDTQFLKLHDGHLAD